jgi:hypothetical protein
VYIPWYLKDNCAVNIQPRSLNALPENMISSEKPASALVLLTVRHPLLPPATRALRKLIAENATNVKNITECRFITVY